jgi:hypothetical protein
MIAEKAVLHEAIDVGAERYYTPQELAKVLHVTPQTIVRHFRGRPGVIEFGSDETLYKRKRKFMRISERAKQHWIEEHKSDNVRYRE